MAMVDEILEQTKKLKDMTLKEKISYIWHYYKIHIIVFIIVIICTVSIIGTIRNNSKPTYIQAVFINANTAYSKVEPTVAEDYAKAFNVDTNKYNVLVDYNVTLNADTKDMENLGGQIRLDAEYQDGDLDIVCGPENIMVSTASIGSYANLEEVLPQGMIDRLIAAGYEPFYYTEPNTNVEIDGAGNVVEKVPEEGEVFEEPETYIGGIYIDNCEYLKSQGDFGIYTEPKENEKPVLTIAVNTGRLEAAIDFISMITGVENK